jgi:asparagine synthase (glutamine-hydrolysing)
MTRDGASLAFDASDDWGWKRLDAPRWWAYLSYVLTEGIEAVGIFDHLRRRSAGAGLQERHPLLDLDLVEFALRLPPELTFDPVHSRPLFRRAMAGLVPDAHLRRAGKSHFDGLVCDGLLADLPACRRLLTGPGAEAAGYVDMAAVERLLLRGPDMHPRGAIAWANELWRVITLECWLRTQAEPTWGEELPARPVRGRIQAVAAGGAPISEPDLFHLDHGQAVA